MRRREPVDRSCYVGPNCWPLLKLRFDIFTIYFKNSFAELSFIVSHLSTKPITRDQDGEIIESFFFDFRFDLIISWGMN